LAGLSVLDRLVVNLSRAGVDRILLTGNDPIPLPRATALGIQVERVETVPEFSFPVLLARSILVVSVGDLRRVMERQGRLISHEGDPLPLGVVEGAPSQWDRELDDLPVVEAGDPAGEARDELSSRQLEREYWSSLSSASDGWVDRWFNRPVGRRLLSVLVNTPVTPNQVSMAAIVIGLVAAGLMSVGTWWTAVWAALTLQLSAIVDCVDGDLARAHCRESAVGKWLDIVGDQVVHLAVFLGLGVGLWRSGHDEMVLALGVAAATGVVLSFLVVLRALRRPDLRGAGGYQKLLDATTNRDFSVVLILFALCGLLPLFLWMAAVGSHLFWIAALALQSRASALANEQVR
jgi:phosphatidylglycerophosphate synthase